jgi:hypothetical protein
MLTRRNIKTKSRHLKGKKSQLSKHCDIETDKISADKHQGFLNSVLYWQV